MDQASNTEHEEIEFQYLRLIFIFYLKYSPEFRVIFNYYDPDSQDQEELYAMFSTFTFIRFKFPWITFKDDKNKFSLDCFCQSLEKYYQQFFQRYTSEAKHIMLELGSMSPEHKSQDRKGYIEWFCKMLENAERCRLENPTQDQSSILDEDVIAKMKPIQKKCQQILLNPRAAIIKTNTAHGKGNRTSRHNGRHPCCNIL